MALIKILSTLTDDQGSVAFKGVSQFDWEGADFPDDLYRASAGVLEGVGYVGKGTLATPALVESIGDGARHGCSFSPGSLEHPAPICQGQAFDAHRVRH